MTTRLTPGEKALKMAYIHAELLKTNLTVTIHELKVAGKEYKAYVKQLEKLRKVAYETFKEINSRLKKHDNYDRIREDIEQLLDVSWSE